jgi:hypothetical protein
MLSPEFLRFQAAICLRSARSTDDPDAIVELDAMAADLECWADEAETEAIAILHDLDGRSFQ